MCVLLAKSRTERILEYDERIAADPNDKNARNNRRELLNKWYEQDIEIVVQVANNEQLPWTEGEIGLPTEKMKVKQSTGHDQVGDYNFTIICQNIETTGGLVAERKSLPDLLHTLGQPERWVNLNEELQRFQADDRFDVFTIFAECTRNQAVYSKPPPVVHHVKRKKNPDYKPIDEKTRLQKHMNSTMGKIWSLAVRGAPISWEGTREDAALSYNTAVRHWCTKNHRKIMEIKDEIHN